MRKIGAFFWYQNSNRHFKKTNLMRSFRMKRAEVVRSNPTSAKFSLLFFHFTIILQRIRRNCVTLLKLIMLKARISLPVRKEEPVKANCPIYYAANGRLWINGWTEQRRNWRRDWEWHWYEIQLDRGAGIVLPTIRDPYFFTVTFFKKWRVSAEVEEQQHTIPNQKHHRCV